MSGTLPSRQRQLLPLPRHLCRPPLPRRRILRSTAFQHPTPTLPPPRPAPSRCPPLSCITISWLRRTFRCPHLSNPTDRRPSARRHPTRPRSSHVQRQANTIAGASQLARPQARPEVSAGASLDRAVTSLPRRVRPFRSSGKLPRECSHQGWA